MNHLLNHSGCFKPFSNDCWQLKWLDCVKVYNNCTYETVKCNSYRNESTWAGFLCHVFALRLCNKGFRVIHANHHCRDIMQRRTQRDKQDITSSVFFLYSFNTSFDHGIYVFIHTMHDSCRHNSVDTYGPFSLIWSPCVRVNDHMHVFLLTAITSHHQELLTVRLVRSRPACCKAQSFWK